MNREITEIQNKLFATEFKLFCRKEFASHIKKLEKTRIIYLVTASALIPLLFLLFAFEFFGKGIGENYFPIFFINIIALICVFWCIASVSKLYKNDVKKVILSKLLSFAGDFSRTEGSDEAYAKKLKLIPEFDKYYCDDRIKGTYGLLNLDITEVRLKHKGINSFSGILVKIPYYKKFDKETIIRRKSFAKLPVGFEKVEMNNPEFEKFYEVLSTDKYEAKMLVNERFMRRAEMFAKYSLGENITVSFEQGNLNIAVTSKKDWFEIPFLKPAYRIENYREIIMQIITVMKITDSLKTEKYKGF